MEEKRKGKKKERRKERERIERKTKRKRKNHCKGFYFPVQILLELLSPLLLMCIRSNSGRKHKTAAIPYFEMSIKKILI